VTAWLSKIPKSELDFVWTQLRFAIDADPGLRFDWGEIDAATTSKNAVNTFVRAIAHHPRKDVIIAAAHATALERSASYKAHVANAGLVINRCCRKENDIYHHHHHLQLVFLSVKFFSFMILRMSMNSAIAILHLSVSLCEHPSFFSFKWLFG
jgi:hypothetical protein